MKQSIQNLTLVLVLVLATAQTNGQISMNLQDALKSAAKANRELQIRRLEILKSGEELKESRSFWLPAITGSANYSFYFDRQNIFMPGNFVNSSKPVADLAVGGRHTVNAVISASQPILNNSINDKVKLSAIDEELQKVKLKQAESSLALAIAQHYLTILLQQQQLKLVTQSLERNHQALKDARSFFLQGKNLKTDTLQHFIGVQNAEATISAINSNISVLFLQLKQLIGVNEDADLVLTDSLGQINSDVNVAERPLMEIATTNRNDFRMQELQIDRSRQEASLASSEFKPQLWAIGQYQVQSQADDLKLNAWPRTSFVGVAVTVPIYSGKRNKYRQNKSAFSITQEQLKIDDLKSKVNTELASLKSQMKEANRQLDIHDHSVNAAQISYNMIGDRYKHGLSSRLELTDAELELTRAKMNQLQAVYNIRIINLQLEHALGLLKL
ncbi:MAG TPA: TolC family protein [Chitinophagaceae bacterium]